MTTDVSPELSRPLAAARVGQAGLAMVVEANAAECEAVARRLLVPAVLALRCAWQLRPGHAGSLEAEGSLRAQVRQVCVVTLDEFDSELVEEFAVRFVPGSTAEVAVDAAEEYDAWADDLDEPDQVPFADDTLDLGEAAVEQLALALDPYPRKPGAELETPAPGADDGPWAALAKLRPPD